MIMHKIVQLQYNLKNAGDFARRLHEEFLKVGVDSSVLTLYNDITLEDAFQTLGPASRLKSRINTWLHSRKTSDLRKNYGQFSAPVLGTDIADHPLIQDADAIYVHWVLHGFLNLKNMEQLAQTGKPIIFILHDMWSITGGCHYTFDCTKYQSKCQSCPMFQNPGKEKLSQQGFNQKKAFYAKYDNIYFASPSRWLAKCAKQSALTKDKPILHIPNVLNRSLFKPFDKMTAKTILGIPEDEKVIAFGAVAIDSPFKGWAYLKEGLEKFKDLYNPENTSVLIFGGRYDQEISEAIPFKAKFLGRLYDELTVALTYNAADVFIAPSLADNLPYTIFESLACGTPVVAFDTGGIPDLVEHQGNGYLAEYRNADDLAHGLSYVFKHELTGWVKPELENERTMQKHLDLLEKIKA